MLQFNIGASIRYKQSTTVPYRRASNKAIAANCRMYDRNMLRQLRFKDRIEIFRASNSYET